MSCFVTASCPFLAARCSGAHYLLVLVGGGHGAAGVGDTVVIIADEVGTGRGLLVELVHRAESYKTVETRELHEESALDSSLQTVLFRQRHAYAPTHTLTATSTSRHVDRHSDL
jgi:hypothetical protein